MARKARNAQTAVVGKLGFVEEKPADPVLPLKSGANQLPPTEENKSKLITNLIFQAWVGVAVWMTFGLLMEGFIGYRIPNYFADQTRREMFRLAHTHGALLSLMLLAVAFSVGKITNIPNLAIRSLRIGALTMPIAFLLAGIWHFGNEPGLAIWLVPISALLIIFGAITMAFASRK